MTKAYYTLMLMCCLVAAYAQNTDSLNTVFNNTKLHDTIRIKALHKLAKVYTPSNPDTALIIYQQEINFAQKIKGKKYEGNAFHNMGLIYSDQNELEKALSCYD